MSVTSKENYNSIIQPNCCRVGVTQKRPQNCLTRRVCVEQQLDIGFRKAKLIDENVSYGPRVITCMNERIDVTILIYANN